MTNKDLQLLLDILKTRNIKIACAESITIGYVQTLLGQISHSSDVFEGGITVYNIEQKVKHLDVDRTNAEACNCVSEKTTAEMAKGTTVLFGADIGIATTGYAEPSPGENVIEPFAFYSLYIKDGIKEPQIYTERVEGGKKNRVEMQKYVAECVVTELLKIMLINKEAI